MRLSPVDRLSYRETASNYYATLPNGVRSHHLIEVDVSVLIQDIYLPSVKTKYMILTHALLYEYGISCSVKNIDDGLFDIWVEDRKAAAKVRVLLA